MRLLSRAELVVAHDTVNRDDWPRNWGADERIKGGKLYTDTSAGRTQARAFLEQVKPNK